MSKHRSLRTSRLLLRAPEEKDIAPLVALHTDPTTNQHRPGGPPSADEALTLIQRLRDEWLEAALSYWTVVVDEAVAGMAGVRAQPFEGSDAWNLYYRLSPRHWGRGLAREAASAAVRAAADVGAPKIVVARTRPSNTAALSVAESIGLVRREGLTADGFVVCLGLARQLATPANSPS